jgi:hypothetical protein
VFVVPGTLGHLLVPGYIHIFDGGLSFVFFGPDDDVEAIAKAVACTDT